MCSSTIVQRKAGTRRCFHQKIGKNRIQAVTNMETTIGLGAWRGVTLIEAMAQVAWIVQCSHEVHSCGLHKHCLRPCFLRPQGDVVICGSAASHVVPPYLMTTAELSTGTTNSYLLSRIFTPFLPLFLSAHLLLFAPALEAFLIWNQWLSPICPLNPPFPIRLPATKSSLRWP
ncbi:hypothetical protein BC835DRAFT_405855 [Cytidiella melzeri]|nr:hypothetical protein BC835DRAFT_405855 [Cytidiella melzeri]